MKRSIIAICYALLLSRPLACSAAEPQPSTPPSTPITEQTDPQSERHPFLEHWHTSIPDNSTPERYDLPGDDWDAYQLANASGGTFKVELFGDFPSEITITEDDPELYQTKLQEKTTALNSELELTSQLNELILVMADGSYFPRTKHSEHKQFTGTIQPRPYDGVVHTIVISEQYTVQPGDTLSQIILDCGWLPEGRSLYGPDGYLEQYANEQHLDYSQPLIPGDIVRWNSEEIKIIDNLYPDIKIGIIPGDLFSSNRPARSDDEILSAIPIVSDLLGLISP